MNYELPRHFSPGSAVWWLGNGTILRAIKVGLGPATGGAGGGVQIIQWDGTLLWDFRYNTENYLSHHDIKSLPNGNVLLIAWETKNYNEAIAAGRNPNILSDEGLLPDHIIEVKPTGSSGGNIVWEWHVWDHLIQDFDPSKENYGVVSEHPELIDINYGSMGGGDFNHINSIDYNEKFDQILLSSHNQYEIWIIDHSTTIEEAAGHSGGKYGKGGDLLYRWGNPQAYKHGTEDDKKYFNQHDGRWIEEGCPGEGNILVFNNGGGRPGGRYSSVDEIIPPVDENGFYEYTPGTAYGPEEQIWIYTMPNPSDMNSMMCGSSQRLPNGNTLICSASQGFFLEVTEENEIVWRYDNPYPFLNPQKSVAEALRYPTDYPGIPEVKSINKN